MATTEESQVILEQDKLTRSSGNLIRIRQQLDLILYDLVLPFDICQATHDQIMQRALNFRRLDVLLGRDPKASEFTVEFPLGNPELLKQSRTRPPPAYKL